jgi:MFS family permease
VSSRRDHGRRPSWSSSLAPLAERPFRLLWLAQTTSAVGSGFSVVALAFGVLAIGGSATSIGLVLAAGSVSRLVLLLIGGVWGDRLPRRQLMVACDLSRMVVQGAVAFLLLTHRADLWELLAAYVLTSAAASFYQPASMGLVAQVVSAPRLQEANALLSTGQAAATLIGPALSGLLVAAVGPGWSFAADAASFAASGTILAMMPAIAGSVPAGRKHFIADLAAGWRELAARSWYGLNLISHALWNLAVAAFLVLGPVIARQRLGGAAGWGLISAGLSAGAIIGGLISLRITPRHPLVTGNLLLLLGGLPLLAGGLPLSVVIICTIIAMAGQTVLNAVWMTAVQQLMPAGVLARVSSYDYLVSMAMMPIGFVLAGPAAAAAGFGVPLTAGAALMIVPSALTALAPGVRGIVRHPDGTITGPPPVYHGHRPGPRIDEDPVSPASQG